MSGLGIQNYAAAPPPKKKNWVKLSLTALMVVIVLALTGAVISNAINWLQIGAHH